MWTRLAFGIAVVSLVTWCASRAQRPGQLWCAYRCDDEEDAFDLLSDAVVLDHARHGLYARFELRNHTAWVWATPAAQHAISMLLGRPARVISDPQVV